MRSALVSLLLGGLMASASFALPASHPKPSTSPIHFKLAAIQMKVVGGDKKANLEHAEKLLAEAAHAGAQVALLPEIMDLGWTDPAGRKGASPIPRGDTCRRLCRDARRLHLYICAGLTERAGKKIYNAAVLISPRGKVLIHYRKLNEVPAGLSLYAQGDRLSVAHTPLGTFGVMICADACSDHETIGRTLGYMGADVILSPSAWVVDADHNEAKNPYGLLWQHCYETLSRDFRMWVVGVSNVGPITGGPWKGRIAIGKSLATNPDGKLVLKAPCGVDDEIIEYLNITPEPRPARATLWNRYWRKHHMNP